jgi:hypothetical protein
MVCARFISSIEIAWFGCGLEGTYDDPRWIGSQVQRLPVEERL